MTNLSDVFGASRLNRRLSRKMPIFRLTSWSCVHLPGNKAHCSAMRLAVWQVGSVPLSLCFVLLCIDDVIVLNPVLKRHIIYV